MPTAEVLGRQVRGLRQRKFTFGRTALLVAALLVAGGAAGWYFLSLSKSRPASPVAPSQPPSIPQPDASRPVPASPFAASQPPDALKQTLPGETPPLPLISKSPYSVDTVMSGKELAEDRPYVFTVLPQELKNASYLRRPWGRGAHMTWLPAEGVSVSRDCFLYLAIMSAGGGGRMATGADLEKLKASGWESVPVRFETTPAARETWTWRLFRRKIDAGMVDVKDAAGVAGCAMIFMFAENTVQPKP